MSGVLLYGFTHMGHVPTNWEQVLGTSVLFICTVAGINNMTNKKIKYFIN